MITDTELTGFLETLAEQCPNKVIRRLHNGSRVQKSSGWEYVIDNENIDKRLGEFPEGAVPYGQINEALRNPGREIIDLFNGSPRVPFSRVYETGTGECLEKAILVQLSAQRGRTAFLINGSLAENGDFSGAHAYNVIFKDGKPFLVDAQNPLAKDSTGRITHPYIAPIIGVEGEYGDFIVPQEWGQGRTYSIS